MSIVSPTGFVRAAVKAQLANAATGLNVNLITYCGLYNVPAWSFDFTGGSHNFWEASVDYGQTEDADIPQTNLLVLYGTGFRPFPDSQREMNASFSGTVGIAADMFVGVLGQTIQNFDWYVDAATAAMLATLNNLATMSAMNARDAATGSGKVYAIDLAASMGKTSAPGPDGENWIVPVRFTMSFGVVIP